MLGELKKPIKSCFEVSAKQQNVNRNLFGAIIVDVTTSNSYFGSILIFAAFDLFQHSHVET